MRIFILVLLSIASFSLSAQIQTEIAAKKVESAPWAIFPRSYHEGLPIQAAVNPAVANLDGQTVDIYITTDRSMADWDADNVLVDVRSTGAQTVAFSGTDLQDLWVELQNVEELDGIIGSRPGVGYDLVVDLNQDGELDSEDLIDGYTNTGMYVVSDLHSTGPHSVDSLEYDSPFGQWQTFRIYYPTDIESMEAQPLLVVSHGWTHNFWYYSHIGQHLASYGYIVMSHENDVGNGGALASTTASESALQNIDTLLTIYPNLGEGILAGKIDKSRIVHSGHSTGGECVARAYNRLYNGDYVSPHITHENIVCVNSIAPVAFLSADDTHPQGSNYHQFLAGADTDVSGAAVDAYVQAFSTFERGYGNRQVTYIHGAGHEDLHNNPGSSWASGPDLIGRPATHTVMLPYFLALTELYTRNSLAMKDFFTRNKNEFRPINIADNIMVSGEYRDAIALDNYVIDDFESNEDLGTSSSGGSVTSTLEDHYELLMKDHDGSFAWFGDQWSNGMTRSRYDDDPNCAAFAWDDNGEIGYEITAGNQDWSNTDMLSFRSCQLTRHPLNDTANTELTYSVQLTDGGGNMSTLNIGAYGAVSPPYPRGAGVGGNGGVVDLCLEEGTYTVMVGGSQWESEMSFVIPGYISGGAGEHELVIGEGDPCTEIEILLFDSWGDGWDDGTIQIIDSEGNIIASETLLDGFGPDEGNGWQNEFYTTRIRLTDFLSGGSGLDLANITNLSFLVGPDHGSPTGAIGMDDIELVNEGLSFVTGVEELVEADQNELLIFPNPTNAGSQVVFEQGLVPSAWSCSVHDINGRLIWRKEKIRDVRVFIPADVLAPGVYMITAQNDELSKVGKMVVE